MKQKKGFTKIGDQVSGSEAQKNVILFFASCLMDCEKIGAARNLLSERADCVQQGSQAAQSLIFPSRQG